VKRDNYEYKKTLIWTSRFILLFILYFPIWIIGTLAVGDLIPETASQPGLMSDTSGMLILGLINTTLIITLIVTSKWHGWRLALFVGIAYYGSFTLLTQIETWYFLKDVTITSELLPRLFIMGLPIPLIYIPIAVMICGKWKKRDANTENIKLEIPNKQLILKFGILAIIYLIIYWLAGYFIAWQNPELRAFYGSPGEITPFFTHTYNTFSNSPSLIILQLARGVLFAAIALPIILASKLKPWQTALLVASLFAIPHLVHINSNPLMPLASVRLSHMVETFTSTFLFGLITVWLLHRRH
jgi:hypothetical protein